MLVSSNQTKIRIILKAAAVLIVLAVSNVPAASAEKKSHHTGKGFQNVYGTERPGFRDLLKWRWQRMGKAIPPVETYHFPLYENDPLSIQKNVEKTTVTWIGHATILLQLGGKNILTDPHFSERASPAQWAGPKRAVPPGLSLIDLPPIDMVLISHDHYDSLDKKTIIALHNREEGKQTIFIVPLGLKKWFDRLGVSRVIELDWWDTHTEAGLEFMAVPTQHWSKRTPFSRNKSLWSGWAILSEDFKFLFLGDTGYAPHFKEIGKELGPFDLAAIPIGAYEPRWFMRHHHISPEEALEVHLDVRSKKSIAIHWGTFMLTDEPLDEPPERLEKAMEDKNVPKDAFLVLQHGETLELD